VSVLPHVLMAVHKNSRAAEVFVVTGSVHNLQVDIHLLVEGHHASLLAAG